MFPIPAKESAVRHTSIGGNFIQQALCLLRKHMPEKKVRNLRMEKKTDLRILKTHKALYDTFLQMLNEKPFDEITVNELCERALVRRATFYKHFADKYDFFSFFIRKTRDSFIQTLAPYEKDAIPYSYYIYLFQMCLQFLNSHERLVSHVIDSSVFSSLLDIFSEEIYKDILLSLREEEKSGTVFLIPIEMIALFYSGGNIQMIRMWITSPSRPSEEEMTAYLKTLLSSIHITDEN